MSVDTLWAALLWSAVGSGFAIYGKKQGRVVPMVGGLAMIGATYFCETALVMSGRGRRANRGHLVAVQARLRRGMKFR